LSLIVPRRSERAASRASRRSASGDAEPGVGLLGAGDGLKDEVDRRAPLDRLERGGHMSQHAGLGRNVETPPDVVEKARHADVLAHVVGHRVDADDGVPGREQQTVEDARRNAFAVVRRVVRLEARRQAPRQPERIAKAGDDATLRGHRDQVLQSHDLGDGGRHLGGDPGGQRRERRAVGGRREQPFAEPAHGEARDPGKGGRVVAVQDQARHLVRLVRHDGVLEEIRQRHLGERDLRHRPLDFSLCRDPRQDVARAQRRGLGEQLAQRRDDISGAIDHGRVAHARISAASREDGASRAVGPQPRPRTSRGRVSDSAGMKVVSSTTGK
jgi:hypothetical protein